MAKSLSVVTVVEKAKLASDVPFVILLKVEVVNQTTLVVDQTLYVANNNEDVVYQGNTYLKFPFEITVQEEAGGVPEVTLSTMDSGRALLSLMEVYGGLAGSKITLMVVNYAEIDNAPELSEYFTIIGGSASDYKINFKLGAENYLAMRLPPRRQFRDRCSWRYKDARCQYAGILASCDLTLSGPNGCVVHSNEINFGGFPGITGSLRYR